MTDPVILKTLDAMRKAERESGVILHTTNTDPWSYNEGNKKIDILFTEGRAMTMMANGRGSIPCTYSVSTIDGDGPQYYTRALSGSYSPLLASIIQQMGLAFQDVVLHVKITFRNEQLIFDVPDDDTVAFTPLPAFKCEIKRVPVAASDVKYQNGKIVYSTGPQNGFLKVFHWGAARAFGEYKIVPGNLQFNRQKFETPNTHFSQLAPEVICGSKKIAQDLRHSFVEGRMQDLMEVMNDFYEEQGAPKITNQGLDWALEKWGETYHDKKLGEAPSFTLG